MVEKKQKQPLIDIEYATHRNFWAPSLIAILLGIGYSGCMYLLTFFIQNIQGKPGTLVGLIQSTTFLGAALAAIYAGKWMKKYTAHQMLTSGVGLFMVGIIMLTLVNKSTASVYLFIAMALIGIGSGVYGPVLKAIIVSKSAPSRMNVVTFTAQVIESIAQRVGASFALAAFAIFAASGNGVAAISKTSLIFVALGIISFLVFAVIPKRIPGIHDISESSNSIKVEEVDLNMDRAK